MTVRCFIDSNILVYTDDARDPSKRECALDLIEGLSKKGSGVISTQVLQEYFSVATYKMKVDYRIARKKTEIFAKMSVIPASADLIFDAIDLHRAHQLSFWDALIVQSALASECRILYSEDMQIDRRIRDLKIVNPFA